VICRIFGIRAEKLRIIPRRYIVGTLMSRCLTLLIFFKVAYVRDSRVLDQWTVTVIKRVDLWAVRFDLQIVKYGLFSCNS